MIMHARNVTVGADGITNELCAEPIQCVHTVYVRYNDGIVTGYT